MSHHCGRIATTRAFLLATSVGLSILLARAAPALAQIDARYQAMAGAGTAMARGLDAVEHNPAGLAFSQGVSIGLLGAAIDVHNNSFSLSTYNDVSGSRLDENDKRDLLDDIPGSGLRFDSDVRFSALGVHVGNIAISLQGIAAGRGKLDRDFFDLVLLGNEVGQTASFEDTHGEGYAVASLTLSYGRKVRDLPLGPVAIGGNLRLLRGFYEGHVESAGGRLTTSYDAIDGEAHVTSLTAEGGSGYAVDVGFLLRGRNGWDLALVFDNLFNTLAWNDTVERHVLSVWATDLNAGNEDLENAIVDSDTTFTAPDYRTSLPRRMRLGASRQVKEFQIVGDLEIGFRDRPGASTTPHFAAGAEWQRLGWLRPRAGFSLGGQAGTAVSGGWGFWWGSLHLDVAIANRGSLIPGQTKGLAGGMSLQLVF